MQFAVDISVITCMRSGKSYLIISREDATELYTEDSVLALYRGENQLV